MWVKIGHAYLNLDNVADVRLVLNEERILTANVEMVSGHVKHFQDWMRRPSRRPWIR
jgi:hypothetical protein